MQDAKYCFDIIPNYGGRETPVAMSSNSEIEFSDGGVRFYFL